MQRHPSNSNYQYAINIIIPLNFSRFDKSGGKKRIEFQRSLRVVARNINQPHPLSIQFLRFSSRSFHFSPILTFYYRSLAFYYGTANTLDGIPPSPPGSKRNTESHVSRAPLCIVRRLPHGLEQTTLDHPVGAVSIITPPRIGRFRNVNAHPLARRCEWNTSPSRGYRACSLSQSRRIEAEKNLVPFVRTNVRGTWKLHMKTRIVPCTITRMARDIFFN